MIKYLIACAIFSMPLCQAQQHYKTVESWDTYGNQTFDDIPCSEEEYNAMQNESCAAENMCHGDELDNPFKCEKEDPVVQRKQRIDALRVAITTCQPEIISDLARIIAEYAVSNAREEEQEIKIPQVAHTITPPIQNTRVCPCIIQ